MNARAPTPPSQQLVSSPVALKRTSSQQAVVGKLNLWPLFERMWMLFGRMWMLFGRMWMLFGRKVVDLEVVVERNLWRIAVGLAMWRRVRVVQELEWARRVVALWLSSVVQVQEIVAVHPERRWALEVRHASDPARLRHVRR